MHPVLRLLIFSLLVANSALMAQHADTLNAGLLIPVQAKWATSDNLGQVYLVTTGNALEKYAPDGRLLTRYTNNRLGNIHSVDVSNPLKVLVWFADFRTVVFLDRSLTPLGELNLISAGFPEVRTVASAADGNIWLYDEIAFQLRKLNPDGTQLFESQPLNLLLPGRQQITCLRDDGQGVFASDPEQGLFHFDAYAQLVRTLPLKGINTFQLTREGLVYLSDGRLQAIVFPAMNQTEKIIGGAQGLPAWLGAGNVLVQQSKGLAVVPY